MAPRFSLGAVVGLALPLFVVTMASQNLPGVAAIRAPPATRCRSRASSADRRRDAAARAVRRLCAQPVGDHRGDLHGPRGAPDPARRYVAAVVLAAILLADRVFSAAVAGLLGAFRASAVIAIAGIALLGSTSATSLALALQDDAPFERADHLPRHAVGLALAGIGSAFWGVAAWRPRPFVQQWRPPVSCARRLKLIHGPAVRHDPLETFKICKDSTFAMMREAAGAGIARIACEPSRT